MTVSVTELEKAVKSLKEALDLYHSSMSHQEAAKKAFRDACIQRFEYCVELCWKTAMKSLGSTTVAAKPAIREMARNNMISNPELWFRFVEARNETSHSYDEEVAARVFARIEEFYPEASLLTIEIRKLL